MARSEDAISAAEADRIFAPLARFEHVVLAVSGGPDSLALLYLMAEWRNRRALPVPHISVATVNHGLRPESLAEAALVAQHAAVLGLAHVTLDWDGVKPKNGIPQAARQARYTLLETYARDLAHDGDVAVATAHHQDDQAETVFMRLSRGGGVDALAAMPSERTLFEGSRVKLVRPLLAFSKAQLIASLSARDIQSCEDPTNFDMAFERPRARAALEASGIDKAALASTARRMTDAREGLAYAAARFEETLSLRLNDGAFACLERRAFDAGPIVLRQTLLGRLIGFFGGATPKPEASEIERLAARLAAAGETAFTLGGAFVSGGERFIRVWREPGRLSIPNLALQSGERRPWDERFWVACDGVHHSEISVRPLGRAGHSSAVAGSSGCDRLPAGAAYGLPAFFAGPTLLAVPQMRIRTPEAGTSGDLKFTSVPIRSAINGF